jgi:hypothetical protein
VSYLVVFFGFLFTIDFWWRWRSYPWSSGFPNETSPLISFAEELKSRERMTGMALDAQHLGDHLQLLASFAEHFKPNATADVRQLSRQMYERALRANVLGCTFRNDVCAARFIPLGFDLEAGEITWSRAVL